MPIAAAILLAAIGISCGRDEPKQTAPVDGGGKTGQVVADSAEPRDQLSESPAATQPVERPTGLLPVARATSQPRTTKTTKENVTFLPASSSAAGPDPVDVMQSPGSTLPADRLAQPVAAFMPLRNAIVGEWVRYAAQGDRFLSYRVVEIGDDRVATGVEMTDHGKPLGMPAMREDPRDYDPVAYHANRNKAERAVSHATIRAGGREWQTILYEDRWTDEEISYVRKTWVSDEVPVFGIVRMELVGDRELEAKLELQEFGISR